MVMRKLQAPPQLEPPVDIRLEAGDNVVEIEYNAYVVPEDVGIFDCTFRWSYREAQAPLLCLRLRRLTLTDNLVFCLVVHVWVLD
jgi:hypothetical protein